MTASHTAHHSQVAFKTLAQLSAAHRLEVATIATAFGKSSIRPLRGRYLDIAGFSIRSRRSLIRRTDWTQMFLAGKGTGWLGEVVHGPRLCGECPHPKHYGLAEPL